MKEDKPIINAREPRWIAVYSISLAVAGLITSEFLPVSILTPIARDLHVTEGMAGQAIQNMNLMCGFDETDGLTMGGLWP